MRIPKISHFVKNVRSKFEIKIHHMLRNERFLYSGLPRMTILLAEQQNLTLVSNKSNIWKNQSSGYKIAERRT